jgi:hypothetical protein
MILWMIGSIFSLSFGTVLMCAFIVETRAEERTIALFHGSPKPQEDIGY